MSDIGHRPSRAPRSRPARTSAPPARRTTSKLDETRFAHPSERVCAEILDFYGIPWEYEARTFPIEFDHRGRVIAYFTPDFYLPDLDLYLELTTMSQKLVTKKNRKVRRLRELYPGINIKILYQKDFKNLLFKYGIFRERPELIPGQKRSR